jgi:hypothetical protein
MWTPDASIIVTAEQKAAQAAAALTETFRLAIQSHVDQTAQARRYDSAVSLASYDTPNQPNAGWRAEAAAFVAWRTAVWEYVNEQLEKVEAGDRPVPGLDQFMDELPAMVWPE